MSELQTTGKVKPASNLYTALLGLACGVVAAAAGYITYRCWLDYETILKIVEVFR